MMKFETPFPRLMKYRKKMLTAKILLKSVLYAFAIFGLLFILLLVAVMGLIRQEAGVSKTMPNALVLQMDFDENYPEAKGDNLLTELSEVPTTSFYDLIKAINVATYDDKVKAIVARVNNSALGLAQIQDLREAIERFKAQGKKAYIHSIGFGSFSNGTSEYYLASAFDEIWMQPNTEAGIMGIGIEVPFFRGILNKIGITPEFYTRYEYKNAFASMVDEKMSPIFKSQISALGEGIYQQILQDVAKNRQISTKDLRKYINDAPILAETALQAKLIDKIGYYQDLNSEVEAQNGAETFSVQDYVLNLKDNVAAPKVAFLVLDGIINEGLGNSNPLNGEAVIGSNDVLAQLEKIEQEKNLKALVLRINSPGGSYNASNEIWYALQKFKEKKQIPFVVSMGDYAASGGYFIALAGDFVFAQNSTITGSIGVLGGKMVAQDLWQKIGINWEQINFGDNAGFLSTNHKFSEKEKAIFNKSLDAIYKDFTLKVSEARKIDLGELDKLARGRVWLGENAKKVGLVDEIGGINAALLKAKDLSGLKADEKVFVVYYPKSKTLQEKIAELLGSSPKVSAARVLSDFGLDIKELNMLKRMQNELVLQPFMLEM